MEGEFSRKNIIRSFLWKFSEKIGAQSLQFILQIILARLLLPEEFGMIILVITFISILNVIVQGGFNTALIQKKEVQEIDYSSVLYLNFFLAIVLYMVVFISAPMLGRFFDEPLLTPIFRVMGILIFLNAVISLYNVLIARKMQFKKAFISSFIGMIISAPVGISMATLGFGVWALVAQQIVNQCIAMIVLISIVKWRPIIGFSFKRIQILFSFSWKILVSEVIASLYTYSYALSIGKLFTPDILAYYNRAEQFPSLVVGNFNNAIQSVIFPVLSAYQDDKNKIKDILRRSIAISSFIIFPMMIGLIVTADPLIKVLLTDNWSGVVPFLQIITLSYIFYPIHTANLQAINAIGRSDIFLKLEIIKKILGLVILLICIPYGIIFMIWGIVVSSFVSGIINAYPSSKNLNYGYLEQVKDICPTLILAIAMGIFIYPIKFLYLGDLLTLILQGILGSIIYIILARVFKIEVYTYIVTIIKGKFILSKYNKP